MESDPSLRRAVCWFQQQPKMAGRFGRAIRQSLDEVFDGQRTGRYSLAQLSKVEKTYIGTKVEIVVQAEFRLQPGRRMDYLVDEQEVDAKWSMKSGGWMIPTEAIGELCLCMTADDARSTFSVGIVRADEMRLRTSENKDRKRRFSGEGLDAISWLVRDGALEENLLLHLEESTRTAILGSGLRGQPRVNQLFRLVQGRLVNREALLTVAQQDDGPKRARDARIRLRSEGILVLGHQVGHRRIAEALGLPSSTKGTWLSARVVPADSAVEGAVEIAGQLWRRASASDPAVAGPARY